MFFPMKRKDPDEPPQPFSTVAIMTVVFFVAMLTILGAWFGLKMALAGG